MASSLRSACILQAKTEFETGRMDVYVFDIVHCNCGEDRLLAAAGSNNFIKIYKEDNLQFVSQISDHLGSSVGTISSLVFSENQLWGSFTGGTIRSWDMRSGQKPVCILQGYNKEPFNCVTANCTGLLAGGTDKIGEDASIYIWDVRSGRLPVGIFTESHSDDITQVLFSPSSPKHLTSGSTDGLVCLFDLTTMEEEEAILSVKNSESSVANVGFFGPDSEYIYCLTHQETFHTWSVTEAEPISSQINIRERIAEKYAIEVNYLVDCYYQESSQKLFMVAGDHSGGMHVFHANSKELELQPERLLTGGHASTVRTLLWSEDKSSIVSGGEDGALCLWLPVK